MSKLDLTLEPERRTIRRLEMITGTGRRRRWSEDDKARIVEETLAPGAVVSQVARRHGLTPQQVFTWRREARQRAKESGAVSFVPVVMTARADPKIGPGATIIEIVIGTARVRVPPGIIDVATLQRVLHAVKAAT